MQEMSERAATVREFPQIRQPPAPDAAYPKDSVLETFMAFAREYSESEDSMLIGAVLPVAGRLLGRRVSIGFGMRKYPNLFSLLVTKPGLRKSTNIRLVEKLGRALLPQSTFLEGATSEQSLFKQYRADADRLLIEDEGNTVVSNWVSDAAGKIVAKRFLRLYDCVSWQQDYIRQQEEDGEALQRIDETSASLLIGTTFNNCRFHGLDTRDGMRRRVCYYVSEVFARTIHWPPDLDGAEFARVVEAFRSLLGLRRAKARIEAVACDMSAAYWSAVLEHLPEAAIVFDQFHIVKLANEKIDDLRRALQREGEMLGDQRGGGGE